MEWQPKAKTIKNPKNFENDLSHEQLIELNAYTHMARNRLLERDTSIAEEKTAFYSNRNIERPPLTIADFPARLINVEIGEYYTNTVTHYKAYCAALARFGQDYVFTYTATWEYKLIEKLGGKMTYMPSKAPETAEHPFHSPEDITNAPSLDIDNLISDDLALKKFVDNKIGDLIGPGQFVTLDSFSEVCSLLRNPENLMLDIIKNPQFVHDLCSYILDIQIKVITNMLAVGPTIFFMPGYTLMLSPQQFIEFALPYIEKLVSTFPGVPMLIGSGGKATHLIEPLMKSSIPVPFIDAASDLKIAIEKAKEFQKPFTVLFPRSTLMKGDRSEIRSTVNRIFDIIKEVPFCFWTEAILGGDVPNYTIDIFLEAYKDRAFCPHREDSSKAAIPEVMTTAIDQSKHNSQIKIVWQSDGEGALKKNVPFMFRKAARKDIEQMAIENGITQINAQIVERFKKMKGF